MEIYFSHIKIQTGILELVWWILRHQSTWALLYGFSVAFKMLRSVPGPKWSFCSQHHINMLAIRTGKEGEGKWKRTILLFKE